MSKPWPALPFMPELHDDGCFQVEYRSAPAVSTACKHGKGDCEDCGTTSRRDFFHTTHGGKGVVGRLSL